MVNKWTKHDNGLEPTNDDKFAFANVNANVNAFSILKTTNKMGYATKMTITITIKLIIMIMLQTIITDWFISMELIRSHVRSIARNYSDPLNCLLNRN